MKRLFGSVQEDTVVLEGIIDNARTSKLLIDGQTGGDRVDVQAADGVWLVDLRDPNQQFIQENVFGGERVLSLKNFNDADLGPGDDKLLPLKS